MKKIILGIAFCFVGALSSMAQYTMSAQVDASTICEGTTSFFADSSSTTGGNITSWSWDFGDGGTSTAQHPSYTYVTPGTYNVVLNVTNDSLDPGGTDTIMVTVNSTPNSSLVGTNVSCNGSADGSIDATVTGGNSPYSYNWSNAEITEDILNLSAGSYTLDVSDNNGCMATQANYNVTEPLVLIVSDSIVDVSSNGGNDGEIYTFVSGGTNPYTYGWSTGNTANNINGISAGSFTVTVTDANNCSVINSSTVNQPSALIGSITATDESSNGACDGSASASASGGTPPYTYDWMNGVTASTNDSICVGTYSIVITDNQGATDTLTYTISTATAALTLSGTSSDETATDSCDGTATVSVSGGLSPYTYAWDNDSNNVTATAVGLCDGTYTVVVYDEALSSQSYTFTIGTEVAFSCTLGVSYTSSNPTVQGANDGSISVATTGTQGNISYAWNPNSADISANATNLAQGTYMVIVSDDIVVGCQDTIVVTLVDGPAIMQATKSSTNETSDGACDGTATISATGGNTPYTYNWAHDTSITGSTAASLCAGTYMVSVTDGSTILANQITIGTDSTSTPTPLVVAASKSNTTCGGVCDGSGTLTATGGTAPYTFAWSNGSTSSMDSTFCAGTHSYTVTDAAGNTGLGYVNIQSGASLSVAVDSSGITNATCGQADGSAGVMAVGGTPPYVYSWSGGQNTAAISNVIAGMHTVAITDAVGCTSSFSLVIANSSGPSVSVASSTSANCGGADGNIVIAVTGGASPYSYLWGNGVTQANLLDATSGVHYVQVTDANGCVGSASAYIAASGTNAPTIFGNVVSQAGGNITSGSVAIYADAPYTSQMDTLATAPIDNQGNFYFSSILPIGDYILQVLPDVSQHPNAIPTYNGLTNRWDSATVVTVACDENWTYAITTFDLAPLAGLSSFDGVIISDGTGGRRAGDPIPGIDVSLEQVPGGIIAFTETGGDGKFQFDNVPTGNNEQYQLHVDIPGLSQAATYNLSSTSSDTTQSGLDFVVSEQGINTVAAQPTGLVELQHESNIRMYPNPTTGDLLFNMTLTETKEVSVVVYNVIGEQVQNKAMGTYHEGTSIFKVTGLSAGVYSIAVQQGNTTSTFKALVVE